jgi:Gpi18-like mannosyltransferase
MNVNEMKTPIIGMFMRWDSEYYLSIAKNGYPLGYPNVNTFPTTTASGSPMPKTIAYPQWAFFPLYSAVMAALALVFTPFLSLTPSLMLSGVIISNISFFVSAYFFYKLTRKLFNSRVALISTAFYSFWVGGVFFSAIYSEALFMALALGAFYYLEENKLPIAVFLGFLATFTRSDGFLIFIPFFIYGLLQLRTSKVQSLKLLFSSAIVASPYLLWSIVGYFLAGGVFPVQLIAHNSNWGIDPPLIDQFVAPWCSIPRFQLFYVTALIIMLIPIGYFLVRIEKIFSVEAKTLKYWGFYAR